MILRDILYVEEKSNLKAELGKSEGLYNFFSSGINQNKFINEYQFNKPSLIFSSGGSAAIHYCDIPFSASTDCFVMNSKNKEVITKYIYYYFIKNIFLLQKGFRGSGLKHIRKDYILNLEINIPNKLKQQQIIDILDKVNSVIKLRKEQLNNIDLLIKSRFNELFGDIVLNTNHWDCILGKKAFKFSSGLFLPSTEEVEYGYPIYGGNGIKGYSNKYLIDYKTLVIGRVGVNCGNVKLINGFNWITDNAIYIKEFKTNEFILEYLFYYMNIINFSTFSQKSGQPKITQKPLENYNYLIPPKELQEEFAIFVNKADKLRINIEKNLNETETLRKALMQKYFD